MYAIDLWKPHFISRAAVHRRRWNKKSKKEKVKHGAIILYEHHHQHTRHVSLSHHYHPSHFESYVLATIFKHLGDAQFGTTVWNFIFLLLHIYIYIYKPYIYTRI